MTKVTSCLNVRWVRSMVHVLTHIWSVQGSAACLSFGYGSSDPNPSLDHAGGSNGEI